MGRKKRAEEVYHVEVITRARVSEEGDWEYLVKWAGYDSDADSWEPQENVSQCNRLLASFWKHVGMDDKDYPIGYEAAADEDWIDKEKRYFKETFVKSSKRRSDKASTKRDTQEKQRSNLSTPHMSESSDESNNSDEGPLATAPAAKKHGKITRVINTESESEVDERPRKQANVSLPKATAAPSKEVPKATVPAKRQETQSATTYPFVIAPPKVTAARTHQEQKINPLVKSLSLSSKSVEAGSSLSTKQRIAAGIPPPRIGPKPLPPAPKTSFPSLSFKKNKPPIPPSVQNKDAAVSRVSAATPTSPVVQSMHAVNDVDVVASPQPMDIDQVDLFDSTLDDAGALGGSSGTFVVPIPQKSQEEINAERFLQTIDIPLLSTPLETAVALDQSNQSTEKALAIPKIRKKWKWSGELYISTSDIKTEPLCAVTIADSSGTSNSSHINLLLSSLDSLQISKLYPVSDLLPLLQACGKPQYFGRLEANDSSEDVIIHGLEHHLTSEGLAIAISLLLDGTEAAVLIVFPRAQKTLIAALQVPEHLLSGTSLLVVLLPFLISSIDGIGGWRSMKTVLQSSASSQDTLASLELSQQAMLYQSMSLLCFPKALLDFLHNSTTSRTYCIWPLPDQSSLGLDTIMLQCILKSTKAMPVKLEEDVRTVFICNKYLNILHTMPSLVTKRLNSPETQFWTYGYAPSTTHKSWRVQEIYPLGGIATFTSSALAEDLVGCYQLISQITEHPLWDCFLVPEVLAMSHMLCNDKDICSSSESCLDSILDLIHLGLVSVMRMPGGDYSDQLTWLSHVFHHSNSNGHDLLKTSLEALKSCPTTSGMTTEQLVTFTNNAVTKDLLNAQIQPAFMESYRRFVIIRAASEDTIPFDKDGLEWSSLSLFSFKDDYFQP